MITSKAFSDALANWLANYFIAKIPMTALYMRGVVKATEAMLRIRPNYIQYLLSMNAPDIERLGAFCDDKVDSELFRVSLTSIMSEVKSYDLSQKIPRFTYNITEEDVKSLGEALKKAEEKETAENV